MRRSINKLFDLEPQEVVILAPEELYGSKIKAFVERGHSRDLFDIHLLSSSLGKLDFKILKRASIFYCSLELKSDLRDVNIKHLIDIIDEKRIKRELRPLLRREFPFDVIEAKRSASSMLFDVFDLDEEEREYVDSFYSMRYRPELLFPENPLLKYHSAAEWRINYFKKRNR